jgi:hypothetical protein
MKWRADEGQMTIRLAYNLFTQRPEAGKVGWGKQ